MIVSDSGLPSYTTFASGHAITPVHLGDTGDGVTLDISGDIQNILLGKAEAANINVLGNAVDFAFEGQNLSANDTTHLNIGGNYSTRSDFTSVTLSDSPSSQTFNNIFTGLYAVDPTLASRLTYDAATPQLTIQGIMTAADLAFLLNPLVYVINPVTHQVEVDANGNPVTAPATFTTDLGALQQLYTATQDVPTPSLAGAGLQIGGPGHFDITADNMDLGISSGIRSVGPLNNAALASISLQVPVLTFNSVETWR